MYFNFSSLFHLKFYILGWLSLFLPPSLISFLSVLELQELLGSHIFFFLHTFAPGRDAYGNTPVTMKHLTMPLELTAVMLGSILEMTVIDIVLEGFCTIQ